jgi:hypothetical protein
MSEIDRVSGTGIATPSRVDAGQGGRTSDAQFSSADDTSWSRWENLDDGIKKQLSALSPGSRHLVAHFDTPGELRLFGNDWGRNWFVRDIQGWILTDLHYMTITVTQSASQHSSGWVFGGITARAERWSVTAGSIREDRGSVAPDHLSGHATQPGSHRESSSEATVKLGSARFLPVGVREQLVRFVPQPSYAHAILWQSINERSTCWQLLRGVVSSPQRVIAFDAARSIEPYDGESVAKATTRLHDAAWDVTVYRAGLGVRDDIVLDAKGLPAAPRKGIGER